MKIHYVQKTKQNKTKQNKNCFDFFFVCVFLTVFLFLFCFVLFFQNLCKMGHILRGFSTSTFCEMVPLLRTFLTKMGPLSMDFWWKSSPWGHIPVCLNKGVLKWQPMSQIQPGSHSCLACGLLQNNKKNMLRKLTLALLDLFIWPSFGCL